MEPKNLGFGGEQRTAHDIVCPRFWKTKLWLLNGGEG